MTPLRQYTHQILAPRQHEPPQLAQPYQQSPQPRLGRHGKLALVRVPPEQLLHRLSRLEILGMPFERGDTRMPSNPNPIILERLGVAVPPRLHDRLTLEMRHRQRDRHLLPPEHFVKQPIVALHRRRHSVAAHAKQKEADPTRGAQSPDQLGRLLHRAHVLARPRLGLFQPDGVPEPDRRRAELELVLGRGERACDAVGRHLSDVPPREEVDERAFADAGFSEEDDVQVLGGDAPRGERVVDDEVTHETLAVVTTPWDRGVCVVGEGGDGRVCAERHAEVGHVACVGLPPSVHAVQGIGCVGLALQFSDDCDERGFGGHTVAKRESCVVSLFHAARDTSATPKTEDDEVDTRTPGEFCQEGS